MNYAKAIYSRWGENPVVQWSIRKISNIQRELIFAGTSLEPVHFMGKGIALGQATHPDLLWDDKTGRLLMTVSNYPYGIERLEDSFILSSQDGIHFSNILNGAVQAYGGCGDSHFSDGELLFDGKSYSLYYRFCERDHGKKDIIFLSTSLDGNKWSSGKEIIVANRDGVLSPALLFENGRYIMYYVALTESGSKLCRCDSASNDFQDFFDHRRELKIENLPEGNMLWHLNVSADDEKLHGLFTLSTGHGGAGARLYYAESQMDRDTWIIKQEIDPLVKDRYIKKVYRSALIKIENTWYLYQAICTKNDCWYIARRKFSEIC